MPEIDTVNLSQFCVGLKMSQFQADYLLHINSSIATKNMWKCD